MSTLTSRHRYASLGSGFVTHAGAAPQTPSAPTEEQRKEWERDRTYPSTTAAWPQSRQERSHNEQANRVEDEERTSERREDRQEPTHGHCLTSAWSSTGSTTRSHGILNAVKTLTKRSRVWTWATRKHQRSFRCVRGFGLCEHQDRPVLLHHRGLPRIRRTLGHHGPKSLPCNANRP